MPCYFMAVWYKSRIMYPKRVHSNKASLCCVIDYALDCFSKLHVNIGVEFSWASSWMVPRHLMYCISVCREYKPLHDSNVIDIISSWPLAVQIRLFQQDHPEQQLRLVRVRPPFDKLTSSLHMLFSKDHPSLNWQFPPQIRLSGQKSRPNLLMTQHLLVSDHSELVVLSPLSLITPIQPPLPRLQRFCFFYYKPVQKDWGTLFLYHTNTPQHKRGRHQIIGLSVEWAVRRISEFTIWSILLMIPLLHPDPWFPSWTTLAISGLDLYSYRPLSDMRIFPAR
jgi:hypothetical protein